MTIPILLKDLIKQYPELGEVLAEYENRLACLENSQPYHKEESEARAVQQDMEWTPKQWDAVLQTKAMVLNIDSKIKEVMVLLGITYDDESGKLILKRKKKGRYFNE